jgi:hypothetical protein
MRHVEEERNVGSMIDAEGRKLHPIVNVQKRADSSSEEFHLVVNLFMQL